MSRVIVSYPDGLEVPIEPIDDIEGTEVTPSRVVVCYPDGLEVIAWEPRSRRAAVEINVDPARPVIWTEDAPSPGREANLNADRYKSTPTERAFILDWAVSAGIRYVREAIGESIGGNSLNAAFNWTWFDAIVDECEARGLKLLGELKCDDITNPDNYGPQWEAAVIYKVTSCVQRLVDRGKIGVIERFLVWNEPDADQGSRTLAEHAAVIIRCAQISRNVIKSISPTSKLEFPPCSNVGVSFFQELLNRGASNFCDIFGIHTYQSGVHRWSGAGTNNQLGIHYAWVRMAAGGGPQVPLACSEWATMDNRAPAGRRTRNLSNRKPNEYVERTISGTSGQTEASDATATVAGQILYDNAGAGTFTVRPDASASLPTGAVIELVPINAGSMTASPGSGVLLSGSVFVAAPGAPLRLTKTGANAWSSASAPAGLYGSLPASDAARVENWHAHFNMLARVMLAAAACSSDTYYSVQGSGDGWSNGWFPYTSLSSYTERSHFTATKGYLFKPETCHMKNFDGSFEGAGAQVTVAGSDKTFPWVVHYNPMGTVFGTANEYPEWDRVTFPTNAALARSGARYCRMAGGSPNEVLRTVTGVIPGRTYAVRAWVALDSGGGGQCELRGYGYDPLDGDAYVTTAMTTADGQYQQVEIQITPQLPCFVIGLWHSGTNNCRWDDVEIMFGTPARTLAAITTHSMPRGAGEIPPYADFSVTVNGSTVPVYQLSRATTHKYDAVNNPPTEPVGHAYFDMGPGEADVVVTVANRGTVTSALVLPAPFGVAASTSGTTVRFTIPRHGHYILYVNGDASPLYISAMPPVAGAPAASGDANVAYYAPGASVALTTGKSIHYFGPGIYTLAGTQWSLRSGDQVYLAAGAVVRGRMFATTAWDAGGVGAKSNIKIFGRGILNNADPAVHSEDARESVLNWLNVSGLTVEGICQVNSAGFCNKTIRCRHILYNWVRTFGRGRNSDGIDMINCQSWEIGNMLIVNWDDSICIKAIGDGDDINDAYYPSPRHYADAENSVHTGYVHDCVINAQCGNGDVEIGYECVAPEIYNIAVERIYSVRSWHKAFMGIFVDNAATPSARVHNIKFRDMYCEDLRGSGTTPNPKAIDLYIDGPMGSIDTISMENVYMTGTTTSLIDGYNASPNDISGVTIKNFRVNGAVKLSAAEAGMTVTNATDVSFVA